MKLLTRICRIAKRVFSDKRLNQIMCGMANAPVCLWSLWAYVDFARAATPESAAFAHSLALVCAIPWAVELAILLNLRERSFELSQTGLNVEREAPSPNQIDLS